MLTGWTHSLRLFQRSRTFREYRLWGTFSDLGSFAYFLALGWLVYQVTDSPFMLGVVAFARTTPVLVLAWYGGVLSDRYQPHRVLLATQSCLAVIGFALAALAWGGGTINVWLVAFLVLFEGIVNAFDIPARQAITRYLVDREDLADAVAISVAQFNLCRMLGPILAGITIEWVGAGWCFALNGLSYFAVLGVILRLRRAFEAGPAGVVARAGLSETVGYLRGQPAIVSILIVAGIPSLFVTHYNTLLPAFVDASLGQGATVLGSLLGAAGAGAVAGSLVNTALGRSGRQGGGLIVATVLAGLALAALPIVRLPLALAVLLFVVGGAQMVGYAQSQTLVQEAVSDEMRGRVLALLTLMTAGMSALGTVVAASVATITGVDATFVAGGIVCAGAAVAVWLVALAARGRPPSDGAGVSSPEDREA